jgi:hypothetical protein
MNHAKRSDKQNTTEASCFIATHAGRKRPRGASATVKLWHPYPRLVLERRPFRPGSRWDRGDAEFGIVEFTWAGTRDGRSGLAALATRRCRIWNCGSRDCKFQCSAPHGLAAPRRLQRTASGALVSWQ